MGSSQSPAVHTTGTAAGIASAAVVLLGAVFGHFTGHHPSEAVSGAEFTVLTYALGAWLHVPTS